MMWFTGIAAAVLTLLWIAYAIPFWSPPWRHEDIYDIPAGEQYQKDRDTMTALIREMDAIPYEEVYITSYDGTRLFGRYYHVKNGAPIQIQLHGWRGTAIRDFCGGNKLAREMGLNTLVADQRAHGKSGGSTITFGIKERQDCLCWARYAAARFPGVPITLAGVSMGAATVLMAAGLDLPEAVVGILADSPYSSPAEIIKKVCRDDHVPPAVLFPFIAAGARLFGRFDIHETTALAEIRKAKVPVLIIHGEDDRFVPCDMSRALYGACPAPKLLYTFPGAGHGISYIADRDRYEQAVRAFMALL